MGYDFSALFGYDPFNIAASFNGARGFVPPRSLQLDAIRPLAPVFNKAQFQLGLSPMLDFSQVTQMPQQGPPNPAQVRPDVAGGSGGWSSKLAGMLGDLLGGSEGHDDVTAQDQSDALFGSLNDAVGPAAFKAAMFKNPWLGIADTLDAARHGYDKRIDQAHQDAVDERKQKLAEMAAQAEIDRTKAETTKLDTESQQLASKKVGYQQTIAGLKKTGADSELVDIAQGYVDAGDYAAAEKAIAAAEASTAAAKGRSDDATKRELQLKASAEEALAQDEAAHGYGPIKQAQIEQSRVDLEKSNHADAVAQQATANKRADEQLALQKQRAAAAAIRAKQKEIDAETKRLRETHLRNADGKPTSDQGIKNQAIINVLTQMPADVAELAKKKLGATDRAWAARKAGLSWDEILDALKNGQLAQ